MYELSLFGQVTAARHEQVLKVLAGVAAMAPRSLSERHLIFKPTKAPSRRPVQVGGSQGIQVEKTARQIQNSGEVYYLQLIEILGDDDAYSSTTQHAAKEHSDVRSGNQDKIPVKSKWSIRFYDLPEAGKRPVTTRMMSSTNVIDGDPIGFMEGMGYQFVHQYTAHGHQLVRHNTVLSLHRILQYPQSYSQQLGDLLRNPAPLHSLIPLDESGGYMLHAYVRVLDGSKPESMSRGAAELATLKELLKGCVDLRPVDRLALDTRVK